MPVSLPTAADVRKVRDQAVERAEVARTPLLAVLGAGDLAVATVSKVVTGARSRATAQAEGVQTRVAELPQRMSSEELRKIVAEVRVQAGKAYAGFAERGEQTWGKLRTQPQVKHAIETIETYTDKLDARVDSLVDDARDVAEKAMQTVTRQTRSVGEKAAQATQRFTGDAAETVLAAAEDTSAAVAKAGTEAAVKIDEAGDDAASATRNATRKAANRTAPKAPVRKTAGDAGTNGASSS